MRLHLPCPYAWLALSLAMSLAACLGTSTGNPTMDGRGDNGGVATTGGAGGPGGGLGVGGEGAGCQESGSTPVEPDEQTELGFSARQVLDIVEGVHEDTLTWNPQTIAEYGPENGQHGVTLTVTAKDTPARLKRYTSMWGGAEIGLAGGGCSPALVIDVRVELRTDQGALNESFDATLHARHRSKIMLFMHPDPDELGGSFAITQVHMPGFALTQLDLSILFTSFGISGELTGVFTKSVEGPGGGATAAAGGGGPIASWGLARCSFDGDVAVPFDAKVAGFSGDDVVQRLNGVTQADLTWSDGSKTTASVAFAKSSAGPCATLEDDPYALNGTRGVLAFGGVLSVRSQDGRIDAAWPVQVRAQPDADDALGELIIQIDHMRLPQAGTVQERYGVAGVDASGYDGTNILLGLKLVPGGTLSGELTVSGFVRPMCSNEPIRDQDGNIVGSPGCQGITPVPLAHALFGDGVWQGDN